MFVSANREGCSNTFVYIAFAGSLVHARVEREHYCRVAFLVTQLQHCSS